MTNIEKLKEFYSTLRGLHCCVPDMRFGQLIYAFVRWMEMEQNKNVFYLTEDEFIEYYTKFMKDIQAKHIPNIEGKFNKKHDS